jgi:hypothetical protein
MATNRGKRQHKYKGIPLDPSIEEFFWGGFPDRGTPGWSLKTSRFFDEGQEIADAWKQHKKFLLNKWQSEGRTETPFILSEGGLYAKQ